MQFRDQDFAVTQSGGSIQLRQLVECRLRVVAGFGFDRAADSGQFRGIQLGQDAMHVSSGIPGRNAARHGRHGQQVDFRIQQRQQDGQRIANPRIGIYNQFSLRHRSDSFQSLIVP